jgi:hypothetical protein
VGDVVTRDMIEDARQEYAWQLGLTSAPAQAAPGACAPPPPLPCVQPGDHDAAAHASEGWQPIDSVAAVGDAISASKVASTRVAAACSWAPGAGEASSSSSSSRPASGHHSGGGGGGGGASGLSLTARRRCARGMPPPRATRQARRGRRVHGSKQRASAREAAASLQLPD